MPDIDTIADEEWKIYISKLAWEKVREEFKGKVEECFQMFLAGESVDKICAQLEIKKNTAYVFRKRVQTRMRREILRLEEELG